MKNRIFYLLFLFICINTYAYAHAFDINSFSSGIQQKNTPEQWIKKNQIPNYDESYLNQGNLSGYEDQQKAQKFMDMAAQMIQSQYTYTCSMIRKVEDKTFYQCNVDGSIYPSMDICTANCNSTYACSQEQCLSQNMCSSFQTCPLGDYPCTNNSCTQSGVCSSSQITTTQYQCPTTGQTYSDQNQCNSACIQTAACTLPSVTVSGSLFQIGCHPHYLWPSGNWIFQGAWGCNANTSINISGCSISGSCVYAAGCDSAAVGFKAVNNSTIAVMREDPVCTEYDGEGWCIRYDFMWVPITYWTVSGCTVSGEVYTRGGRGARLFYGSGNRMLPYNGSGALLFNSTSYTCPLSGGSACSGNPPTCSKPTTCTTQNITTTKYQCSLTGTQYDTQDQCTSACFNTATCNTNYKCTYENSIYSDASTCQSNCSFFQCPSDGAYYLTASDCQNACGSFICSKNGVKYLSQYDCQANCKEAGSCTAQ